MISQFNVKQVNMIQNINLKLRLNIYTDNKMRYTINQTSTKLQNFWFLLQF